MRIILYLSVVGQLLLFAVPSRADSLNVSRLSRFTATWNECYAVSVRDSFAYVAAGGYGLRIINLADPVHPVEYGFVETPGWMWGVTVNGNYAYAGDGSSGVQIIDISNPAAPALTGTYNTPGFAWGVAVAGSYAYVADLDRGLRILNITNPAAPTQTGFFDTAGEASDVVIVGNRVYLADGTGGLRIFNVTNPAAPTLTGTYNTPGVAYGVAVAGNYAYVADEAAGLQVINVTNPASPTLTATLNTAQTALCVKVWDNYAFLTDGSGGLRVIDISMPSAPFEVGFYDGPGTSWSIAVDGCNAVVAEGTALSTYDVSACACQVRPNPPGQLVIRCADVANTIRLQWNPVEQDETGNPISIARYVIYSAPSLDSAVWDSIGVPTPPDTTVFMDSNATAEIRFYRIRAVGE